MKGLVYGGAGARSWTEIPDAHIQDQRDAIIRVDAVTICGTDLHILSGDVPEVVPGRVLGHEAVGTAQTFELCTTLIRPGGRIANIGVHGKPATLHLENLWIRNITITTGLVNT